MNLILPISPITLTRLFPRRVRDFFSFLQKAGSEDITDEDEKRRVILVNTISLAICVLLIVITPFFYAVTDNPDIIIYPVMVDFAITFSVILLNRKKKHLAASITIYVIQCASIMYFGLLFSNVIALEAMIIFLISIIYLIFKENKYRRICLAIAISTLVIMEVCSYFKLFPSILFTYDTTFVLHSLVLSGILVLIIIVSRPYIRSNDTNQALKLANHFKKIFVHQVTHEMRTPLNAIYGVAQLLKRQIMLNNQFKSLETLVDQQLDAINNTRSIINNVLDMAQIESGVINKSEREHFLPKPFFYKITEVNKVMGRSRNIRIKLSMEQMPEVLYDDILNLHQITTNLLANALKYADRNSLVELKITGMGNKWSLQVINQGPVITPKKQELIFNPFVTDKSKYIEGTGLGLYIVSGKVKSMGGTISLNSDAAGTIFTVQLPLLEGNMELIREEKEEDEMWDDLGHINVLLAEDNELNAQLLSRMLAQIGCNTTWVKNGLELMQQVEKHIPDIIIMDFHMEVMDGEQTLYQLKQIPAYKNIPVIISTGDAYAETRDAFLKAGADAFIEKPINYSSLIKVLKMHLHHNSEELLE